MRVQPHQQSAGYRIRLDEMIERSRQRMQQGVREQIGEFVATRQQRLAAVQAENSAAWLERALRRNG